MLTFAFALGCGGKSVVRADDESVSPDGGTAGTSETGIGMPCQRDYDCLRAEADASSVVVCSSAGRCELGTPAPEQSVSCYLDHSLPPLELNDSRVYQSPRCASGICLLRSYSIDPENTTCTSRCATDADCAARYAWTTTCLPTEIYENGDTGVVVDVCMPPMPW